MCIVELISCYGTLQFSSFVPDCDDDFKPVVAMFSSSPCPDCLLHQMTSLHCWRHVPLSAAPSGGGRQWLHLGGGGGGGSISCATSRRSFSWGGPSLSLLVLIRIGEGNKSVGGSSKNVQTIWGGAAGEFFIKYTRTVGS
jgi:hypothetical protein